jgi:pimeloyl-ACP methyl ester carboxylesterase
VGNSLGGWFALELARRGRALSTVAISPGGGWERGSREEALLLRTFKRMGWLVRFGGPWAPILGHVGFARRFGLDRIVSRVDRLTPAQASYLMRAPHRCEAFYDVLRRLPHEPDPDPVGAEAGPIRVVWGSEDRLLPLKGYSERWRRLLPSAEWVVLEGAGHVPMFDDPSRVAEVILDVTAPCSLPKAVAKTPITLRPPVDVARAAEG